MRLSGLVAILVVLAAGGASLGNAAEPNAEQNRYNVLFIAVDDLRTELGCYGSAAAQSPNLDRLAAEGMRFSNHFVQVATCGASRYALLTGRSPRSSGVRRSNAALYAGNSALQRKELPGAQSLPELFRRSGYKTICIGKISHTPDGKMYAYNGSGNGRMELPGAWDELATPYGPWQRGWGTFFAYTGGRHREDGKGHRDLMEFVAERDEDLPDGLMAQAAIDKLAELAQSNERFFLGLGFFKPHLPFVATKADWEAMQAVDVGPPPQADKPPSAYWHRSGEFYQYRFPFEKTRPLAKEDQVTARRAYLACVRYVDRQIGKVLDGLKTHGLADSTIVVVWGDHGWHLGDSQIWGKHTPLERAVHSPLIIRAPGVSQTDGKSDALVETLDVYPTLVDLCRPRFNKTQHALDGRSLKPLLTGERDSVRAAAVSYWGGAISVRTPTHRLIARGLIARGLIAKGRGGGLSGDVELYDIRKTPDPVENLAAEKPQLVEEMKEMVRRFHSNH